MWVWNEVYPLEDNLWFHEITSDIPSRRHSNSSTIPSYFTLFTLSFSLTRLLNFYCSVCASSPAIAKLEFSLSRVFYRKTNTVSCDLCNILPEYGIDFKTVNVSLLFHDLILVRCLTKNWANVCFTIFTQRIIKILCYVRKILFYI